MLTRIKNRLHEGQMYIFDQILLDFYNDYNNNNNNLPQWQKQRLTRSHYVEKHSRMDKKGTEKES